MSTIVTTQWTDNNNMKEYCKDSSPISEKIRKVAGEELRENEHTKQQCLQHLRLWIKKNQDIENCIMSDAFLLRFLRSKKYSLPMTEQLLLKYLNYRKRFRDFMYGLDYLECPLIKNGYIYVSPYRDANGRRVIIYDARKINPAEVTGREICFAHAITYETLMADEENQIMGFNHVIDVQGVGAHFLSLFSITEFAIIMRWAEQSIPMRHKNFNIINFPSSMKFVFDFIHSNIRSEKLRNRIVFHSSTSDLANSTSKRCLPQELGGTLAKDQMISWWRQELADKRDLLLSYDCMNLLSDRGIITSKNKPSQDDTGVGSLPGSFRKLEVD